MKCGFFTSSTSCAILVVCGRRHRGWNDRFPIDDQDQCRDTTWFRFDVSFILRVALAEPSPALEVPVHER